jgi:hypothetical protein
MDTEDLDSTLFAAAIIAFEVRAGSAAEERLADSLSKFTRESSPDNWLEPLSSLALLPNRWYVRAGLSRIAQSKANLGIVRVAAARKLADLGDQDHGIQILKEIGNFRASTPDLEASWFEASLGLQDNTRRLELGDIDDDDFYASMPSGALVRHVSFRTVDGMEWDDDLFTSAQASWELADLGQIDLAIPLLAQIALSEYNESHYSDYYLTLPSSYWPNLSTSQSVMVRVLLKMAADPIIHPAARLTAGFALGNMGRKERRSALDTIQRLANDSGADFKIRLQAAQVVAYFGDDPTSERLFTRIASDSRVDVNARILACWALEQFGGERAVIDAIKQIAADKNIDPLERVAAALEAPGIAEGVITASTLIEIAFDSEMDIDTRIICCRKLVRRGFFKDAIKTMLAIASSEAEFPEVRVAIARQIFIEGRPKIAARLLKDMLIDSDLHPGGRAMALDQLNELGLT